MVVLGILIAIIACVVRRRTKEPISPPDSAEVRILGKVLLILKKSFTLEQ